MKPMEMRFVRFFLLSQDPHGLCGKFHFPGGRKRGPYYSIATAMEAFAQECEKGGGITWCEDRDGLPQDIADSGLPAEMTDYERELRASDGVK